MHRDSYRQDPLQSPYRALLTDTLPYEVPIIFSNDRFFLTETRPKWASVNDTQLREVEKCLGKLRGIEPNFTIPYNYDIIKTRNSWTRLSIVHPRVQIMF